MFNLVVLNEISYFKSVDRFTVEYSFKQINFKVNNNSIIEKLIGYFRVSYQN